MPKVMAPPIDRRLLDMSRQHLVKVDEDNRLRMRQNYNRIASRLAPQIGPYGHANQFKRMRKAVSTTTHWLCQVLSFSIGRQQISTVSSSEQQSLSSGG